MKLVKCTGIALLTTISLNLFTQKDGTIDETFGINGKVILPVSAAEFMIYDAELLADQRMVCTGMIRENNSSTQNIFVARIKADGSFDTSFNGIGYVSIDINNTDQYAISVSVRPDGKIIAAGYHNNGLGFDMSIVRLNEDGSLDNSFDNDGLLTLNFGSTDNVNKVLVTPDDKIILAGRVYNGINADIALVRLNNDGSFDLSFGSGGLANVDFLNKNEYVYDVILDGNKIVIAGEGDVDGNSVFLVARYDSDGLPDASFGNNGYAIKQVGSSFNSIHSLAKLTNGHYVAAGSANINGQDEFALVSFTNQGNINPDFGNEGTFTANIRDGNDYLKNVVVQEDGRILSAGRVAGIGSISDFALFRLNAEGGIDNDFGDNGTVITDFDNGNDVVSMLAITSDKKILTLGYSSIIDKHQILIARYYNSALSDINNILLPDTEVAPNPFTDKITITPRQHDITDISIYDAKGVLIKSIESAAIKAGFRFVIDDLEQYESGVYYLKFSIAGELAIKKLIKI